MNADELKRSVSSTLSRIPHPGTGKDLLSGGHVQDLEVDEGGAVRFRFMLRPEDPADLVKQARAAVEELAGVRDVKINVQLPQMAGGGGQGGGGGLKPGSVPAPTPKPGILSQVGHVIAVSSGKGGVGKSMVAANLAAATRAGRA